MQQYIDPDDTSTADWMFSLAFAQDQARYAFPVAQPEMQPCKNVDCDTKSFAVFCSEPCRVSYEGDDTEDYYADTQSTTILGHIATADQQWQQDQVAGGFAALVCGVQPTVAPAAVPVPAFAEAPISVTLKGAINHVDTMITLRGTDFAKIRAQMDAASRLFDAPAAAPAPSTPEETEEGWCAIHATQMRWNLGRNNEAGWWSHKVNGEWCKGKVKGQVRHG